MTRRQRIVAGLLTLGALLRIAYLLDYAGLPFVEGPLGDSVVYLHQARRVVAGDHGDSSLLAMSPGYGYFLAALGQSAWLAIAIQSLVGLGAGLLLERTTTRLAGETAGLIALACYVGYGLFPFYESKLLSETLGFALSLGAFALFTSLSASSSPRRAAAAGLVLALAVLMRAHLIFVVPFAVVAAPWRWAEESKRERARRTAGFVLGLALVFGARGVHTLSTADVFVPVLYTAPDAHVVATSSTSRYDGSLGSVGFQSEGPRSAWDVVRAVESHRSRPTAERSSSGLLATAASIDVWGAMRAAPPRVLETFRSVEATFQYAYYGERAASPALNASPISFSFVAALAALGAGVWMRSRPRALLPIAPWILGILMTCVLYAPTARYRLPMLCALLLLAGVGGAWLLELRRNSSARWIPIAVAAAAIFLHGAWRNVAYEPKHPERWHLVMAESLLQQPHDPAEVAWHLERAVAVSTDPDATSAHIQALVRSRASTPD